MTSFLLKLTGTSQFACLLFFSSHMNGYYTDTIASSHLHELFFSLNSNYMTLLLGFFFFPISSFGLSVYFLLPFLSVDIFQKPVLSSFLKLLWYIIHFQRFINILLTPRTALSHALQFMWIVHILLTLLARIYLLLYSFRPHTTCHKGSDHITCFLRNSEHTLDWHLCSKLVYLYCSNSESNRIFPLKSKHLSLL